MEPFLTLVATALLIIALIKIPLIATYVGGSIAALCLLIVILRGRKEHSLSAYYLFIASTIFTIIAGICHLAPL